jgi:methylenetetrahydrofolate dehydrogenase (NADP+)/methenyltetrahydrofolate cyclohydrolase
MAKIIDGRAIAAEVRKGLAGEVARLKKDKITPCLAVVTVGRNDASEVYVRQKEKAAKEIGIAFKKIEFPAEVGKDELMQNIERLNRDKGVHGIIVQLPLPGHLDENDILPFIDPKKDVDGFHPYNLGRLMGGVEGLVACTPKGIIRLLETSGISLEGKNAVIINRTIVVGRPLAQLLLNRNCTVTTCHSKTKNLKEVAAGADILISAVGKAKFVTEDMVRDGAVVIDVGTNRSGEKLCGDVDFEAVKKKASYITPVPGGVGPMTVAMLMENTVFAAKNQK